MSFGAVESAVAAETFLPALDSSAGAWLVEQKTAAATTAGIDKAPRIRFTESFCEMSICLSATAQKRFQIFRKTRFSRPVG